MLDPLLELDAIGDLADDVRRMFEELERAQPRCRGLTGEYSPELDVIETPEAYEIHVDLPGVGPESVRLCFKRGAVVIAGQKLAPRAPGDADARFHRVEREYGRFARAIRLPGAIDASRSRASLRDGELLLKVPKILDRREQEIVIPIE